MTVPDEVGTCCLVLHTHLPWVAHHGNWPVGEEWLYQAWSGAYLPVLDLLGRLADEGRTNLLTLGVTPVVAAMLDDPYCLEAFRTWLGTWVLRAEGASVAGVTTAGYESGLARATVDLFDREWRAGASPVLRGLVDRGAIELLGGPATHTFTPYLPAAVAAFALRTGLDDAAVRWGSRPGGIWAPECAYVPGLEGLYRDHGVDRFVIDGPTVHGDTGAPIDVAGSGVLAFARDLDVTYRVWSPRAGYPGDGAYRDFHTFDHDSGLRPARVTAKHTPPQDKRPYRPAGAAAAVARHAADFIAHIRARLLALPQSRPLVVAAYDTELFGHWWHEGPAFLEAVLRGAPAAGIRMTTLAHAADDLSPVSRDLPAGSWGAGKDFHIWDVPDVRDGQDAVAERLLTIAAKRERFTPRDPVFDQLAREALLALASDWPFAISKDSAADYARQRLDGHISAFTRIADALESGDVTSAQRRASAARRLDGLFGHLDARGLHAAVGDDRPPCGS